MKPRVGGDVSGSEYVKMRGMRRVVASVQINSFAMEFMVEISCLRKGATSSFCKAPRGQARCPWFRKSAGIVPAPSSTSFQKMRKSVVFFYFNSFGAWLGFGFCGLILSFAAFRECKSFLLFLKQQVSKVFLEFLLLTPTLACSKHV